LHRKPIGLLNVGGYFDPLIEMADSMVRGGFLKKDGRALLRTADNINDLFTTLADQVPDHSLRWT
jgi:predicted Rossmann-fold nucleotide-binding protein